jgi:hypothetical protein
MAILLAMAVALLSQDAQAAVPPILHERQIYESDEDRVVATWKRGATNFPEDAGRFYQFHDKAQGVKILSHGGEISGYLLKFGTGFSDKGLVLGYYFNDVAEENGQLWFTTRQVHGVWYGFEGQIVPQRLSASGNSDYLLEGTLTMHDEAQRTTQQDTVSLRSAGPH